MAAARAWQPSKEGLRLRLRVTPRARRTRIEGVAELPDGPALKVAVTAPPEDGKANAAVIALLARALGLPKSALSVVAGASGRSKMVAIAADGTTLAPVLEALAAESCDG